MKNSDLFLRSTEIIDWKDPAVNHLACMLGEQEQDPATVARRCFLWVRDEVRHSADHGLNPVTCSASEVLHARTGFCYAKSHLLAALLRANGIPTGLCYQRLSVNGAGAPYCLHGLNALRLPNHAWYRIDARGDRPGVTTECLPPVERLAFAVRLDGEADLPEIWPDPLPQVIGVLSHFKTFQQVLDNLPDIPLIRQKNS